MLWPELPVLDRFRAAAQAGFRRVEILFVHELDPAAVERSLRELGLELVLFDPRPGDWGKGARAVLRRHFPLIAHGQMADVPGRHQPGTGKQPIPAFLSDLDELGYTGSVGLEYRPQGTTDESLTWLPRDRRE